MAVFLICGLLLMPGRPARAENPGVMVLDLYGAIGLANEKNLEVILSHERVRQAVARMGQTAAGLLPQASAALSGTRQTRNLRSSGLVFPGVPPIVGPFNTFDARLSVTQALFDLTTLERLRAAGSARDLSEADQRRVREDTMALAGTLYLEARQAQEQVRAAKAVLRSRIKQAAVQITARDQGTATELEFQQARSDQAAARYDLAQARRRAIEARLDLAAVLGLPAWQKIKFIASSPSVRFSETRPDEDDIREFSGQHPEVLTSEALEKQRKAEKLAALAEFLPTVTGMADVGASGTSVSEAERTYSFGAKLSWPFFEGGRTVFRFKEASSLVRESRARLEDTRLRTENRAVAAVALLREAAEGVRAAGEELDAVRRQREIQEVRCGNGTGSEMDRLEAMARLAQAEVKSGEAAAGYRMAEIHLAHSLGHMDRFLEREGISHAR